LDDNGNITDDTRIRGALPTLKKILADGGALIIMSHMGKPKGKVNPKYSLSQIQGAVAAALGTDVKFAPDCANAAEAAAVKEGEEDVKTEDIADRSDVAGNDTNADRSTAAD
jgi:phosphoglycerate kinase